MRPLLSAAVAVAALALLTLGFGRPAAAATSCYAVSCSTCSPGSGSGNVSTLIPAALFPDNSPEGNRPISFVDPDDGLGHRFVAIQQGLIYLWNGFGIAATPYLDLRARVFYDGGERGLLAVAADPAYAANGRVYVYYTGEGAAPGADGDIVIERYQRSASNPEVADPTPTTILVLSHTAAGNHNGGWLTFGPNDAYLYVSTGDGGGGCDSTGPNGQNLNVLLGKVLRLDVNSADLTPEVDCGNDYFATTGYDTPDTNPSGAGCDEIWAYGLRNPFRFSFDRTTGDLFVGDVGQRNWEEINFMAADATAPLNFGWVAREGCDSSGVSPSCCGGCVPASPSCEYPTSGGLYDPILCHSNSSPPVGGWTSIMGGYRYRGSGVPGLAGRYLYSDAGCGQIWRTTAFDSGDPIAAQAECWDGGNGGIFGFAEDHLGELYLVNGFGARVDCIHNGSGCAWTRIFTDGLESTDTSGWGYTHPP